MRVLFLTSRLPFPPDRGDKVRTHNLLRAFAARHDVKLISFVDGGEPGEGEEILRQWCDVETVHLPSFRSVLNAGAGLLRRLPLQACYYSSGEMSELVRSALRDGCDALYVHLFRMAPFALGALGDVHARAGRPATILDLTDAISREIELSLPRRRPLSRAVYTIEHRRVRSYEAAISPRFDDVWTISGADADIIRSAAPTSNVTVVPNGVDDSLFALGIPAERPVSVLFVGNFRVPHNVDAAAWLAGEIAPAVAAEVPGVEFVLAGAASDEVVLPERGVVWRRRGFVPALKDVYGGAGVFAAPMRFAAGVQNKILEAMAAGLPVVTTSIANAGLGARPDSELLVRDGARAFADGIVDLLSKRELAGGIAERGRAFVRERFTWDRALERLEEVSAGL
ncbi:MAG: glycosyltransferase [Candidatus Eisenbacteria bacterium]|nr:glycosyltransferase [Candidatus Eisenbacteria bacterium]